MGQLPSVTNPPAVLTVNIHNFYNIHLNPHAFIKFNEICVPHLLKRAKILHSQVLTLLETLHNKVANHCFPLGDDCVELPVTHFHSIIYLFYIDLSYIFAYIHKLIFFHVN